VISGDLLDGWRSTQRSLTSPQCSDM